MVTSSPEPPVTVSCPAAWWLAHGPEEVRSHAVSRVTLTDVRPGTPTPADWPAEVPFPAAITAALAAPGGATRAATVSAACIKWAKDEAARR